MGVRRRSLKGTEGMSNFSMQGRRDNKEIELEGMIKGGRGLSEALPFNT